MVAGLPSKHKALSSNPSATISKLNHLGTGGVVQLVDA
jgi:hypothetical protein